jgi:hypothetical protein
LQSNTFIIQAKGDFRCAMVDSWFCSLMNTLWR